MLSSSWLTLSSSRSSIDALFVLVDALDVSDDDLDGSVYDLDGSVEDGSVDPSWLHRLSLTTLIHHYFIILHGCINFILNVGASPSWLYRISLVALSLALLGCIPSKSLVALIR